MPPATPQRRRYRTAGEVKSAFPRGSVTAIKLRVAISQHRECKACLARIYRGLGTSQGKPCTPFVLNLMAVTRERGNDKIDTLTH